MIYGNVHLITLGVRCNALKSLAKSASVHISILHALITLRKEPSEDLRAFSKREKKKYSIMYKIYKIELFKSFQSLSAVRSYTLTHKTV